MNFFIDIFDDTCAVIVQVMKVALTTNNAVVADGANITVAGVRVSVTALSGYSAPHTGKIDTR